MCGRYQLLRPQDIAARFETANMLADLRADVDVRPTQPIPVIDMERELTLMHWGFVPSWAKERPKGAPLINARAEGIEAKPTFRKPLRYQRCIIPATGFYEWQTPVSGGKKVKYLFTRTDGDFLALAGLYDTWTTPEGLVAPIHNRMPVVLAREDEDVWLNPDETESEAAPSYLSPLPSDALRAAVAA